MSGVPDGKIPASTLRMAIRARISAGISRRAITLLIQAYVVDNDPYYGRGQNGVRRLPVDLIPYGWRAAFLDALDELPNCHPMNTVARPGVST